MIKLIKKYGIKAGLAISPNTPVSDLVPYLPIIDLILVMSVEPGLGGQEFISSTKEKLKEVRTLLKEYKKSAVINVDGGVNDNTVSKCKDADIVTSGSYIVLSDNFQESIDKLRQ